MSTATTASKNGQVRFREISISRLKPSPENDRLYRPVNPADPEIKALAESIRRYGVREALVVTRDRYILSGHRRRAAAKLAGLTTVPCHVEPIRRRDDLDEFVRLLREHNRQRDKTNAERLREEIVTADPREAYESLIEYRQDISRIAAPKIVLRSKKRRARITEAKRPMLHAVITVLEARRNFWPLPLRVIHYALLSDPPLRHASKPQSAYENTLQSYKSLSDLLTRARLAGDISMQSIEDETRPVTNWNVRQNAGGFLRQEIDGFGKRYWRDLLQSQPNHVEIVIEKNTLNFVVRPVASQYTIPLTSGRGFCSLPPRVAMAERFEAGGKEKLIVLFLSDFDPDGEEIAHSFARSMRDDFDIENVHGFKVGLTQEQVKHYKLPSIMQAKKGSSTYGRFVSQYGETVHEIEALDPEDLQAILRESIDAVIDTEAFNEELDAEENDAVFLQGVRNAVHESLAELDFDQEIS